MEISDHFTRLIERSLDEEMAERARSGDTEAFGELIRRHRRQALGWAHSIAQDESLAEDIVQEALVDERVLERLLDRIDMTSDYRHDECEPMKHFLRKESIRMIRSLLQCLNERERGMFEAYFFMHCSADEVARLFSTTPGSVHTYLHRSKLKIQEAIRRDKIELRDWGLESSLLRKRSLSMPMGQPDMNNTFIDRIAKLLRSRGEHASPAEVAGRSGHSFRLKLSQKTTYSDGVFVFDWKRRNGSLCSVRV